MVSSGVTGPEDGRLGDTCDEHVHLAPSTSDTSQGSERKILLSYQPVYLRQVSPSCRPLLVTDKSRCTRSPGGSFALQHATLTLWPPPGTPRTPGQAGVEYRPCEKIGREKTAAQTTFYICNFRLEAGVARSVIIAGGIGPLWGEGGGRDRTWGWAMWTGGQEDRCDGGSTLRGWCYAVTVGG